VAAIGIVATIVVVGSRKICLPLATTSIGPSRQNVKVVEFIIAIVCYCLGAIVFGYLLATAAFLCVAFYRLGVRKRALIAGVTVGWIGASYAIFVRALYVPLPIGTLWETFQ
jgi:hypothetical protein